MLLSQRTYSMLNCVITFAFISLVSVLHSWTTAWTVIFINVIVASPPCDKQYQNIKTCQRHGGSAAAQSCYSGCSSDGWDFLFSRMSHKSSRKAVKITRKQKQEVCMGNKWPAFHNKSISLLNFTETTLVLINAPTVNNLPSCTDVEKQRALTLLTLSVPPGRVKQI